jgi:DNA polymerase III alpha subunit
MRLDKFSNPIFNSKDIFDILYQGSSLNLDKITVDYDDDIAKLELVTELKFQKYTNDLETLSIEEFDSALQTDWYVPEEYKTFDVKEWCINLTVNDEQAARVIEEMDAYEAHNMIPLLQWCKYFVDTCKEKNIVWGVGRGSSVSSYVLYLLEIHQIDSLKYNLDWREFLR